MKDVSHVYTAQNEYDMLSWDEIGGGGSTKKYWVTGVSAAKRYTSVLENDWR